MSERGRGRGERKTARSTAPPIADLREIDSNGGTITESNGAQSRSRPPRALHYLYLNLAFWLFLVFQALVLVRSMGSRDTVVLYSMILGAGFLIVSIFDYCWLSLRR